MLRQTDFNDRVIQSKLKIISLVISEVIIACHRLPDTAVLPLDEEPGIVTSEGLFTRQQFVSRSMGNINVTWNYFILFSEEIALPLVILLLLYFRR